MKQRVVTVKDVAIDCRVSTATVSRVLNNNPRVLPRTREKVRASMAKLGYKVNSVARSLKTRETKTIGVLAPDLAGDFFMYIAESMDRELSTRGYSLVVCSSRDSLEEEASRLKHLVERLVDGVVIIPVTASGDHLDFMKELDIPMVFVDRTIRSFPADAVLTDNEEGAYMATKALIGDGYARIGFIGGKPEVSTSVERLAGFEKAMREAGLDIEREFIRMGPPTLPFGYRAMEEMLKCEDSPDAWFLVNAFTHVGATNCLITEPGPRADRIVFAAFDEMPYSPLLKHCRYSIQQPIAELGRLAARTVLNRVIEKDKSEPQTIRLKTRLIRHI